jgi:hypothetical protein
MARPSFNNIGLRRDLNLSDVDNPENALNNLLNNLVVTDEGQTFGGGDLDAIKGIANSTVTNADIGKMANLAVKNAYLDPETSEIVEEVAIPLITVKNQLDTITATTSDPPFFNGGDGLFADFYEWDQINDNLNINSRGSDVVFGNSNVRKKYWTTGLFEFSNKLDEGLDGANGAIQWEGFYVPDSSGTSTINIGVTGLFILEFGNEDGTYEIKKNVYKQERRVFATSGTSASTRVNLTRQEAATVANGDKVTAVFDNNGAAILQTEIESGLFVNSAGSTALFLNQEVTLPEDSRLDLSIAENIGGEEYRLSIPLVNLEKYVSRKIRITLWWPGEETNYFNKVLDANLSTLQRPGSGSFPYWYLYTEVGEINTDESFKGFYDKRLLQGGGVIGPEDPINSTQYNEFASISPLAMRYTPPLVYADILRAEYRYSTLEDSEVLSVSNTSPYTDDIEIGNIVFANSLPNAVSEVVDIARNNIVIVKDAAESDASLDIKFIDHRGFAASDLCTSTGNTVSVNSNANIRVGDVVVTETYSGSVYIRVTDVLGNTQFTTSVNLNISSLERIYIYRDVGLSNHALDNYCIGVIGKEVTATSLSGQDYITLNNVDDIGIGNIIQSSPFIETVDQYSPGTLTVVTEINPSGYPANTVRISKNIRSTDANGNPIGDMVAGTTVVICPSNTVQNKEACVIPLNTAPPFIGTPAGLRTTDGGGSVVGLKLAGSTDPNDDDPILRVLSFTVQSASNIVELPSSGTFSFTDKFPVKVQNSQFYILGTTNGS